MKKPTYSVIMSIYEKVNTEHLKISIESILNQTYMPTEFIIVKDGKLTNELEDMLVTYDKAYPKLFNFIVFEENSGPGIAYKEAIPKCNNDYIMIMDSDDYAVPTKLEIQMTYLAEHPEVDVLGSNAVEFINTTDNIISQRNMPESHEEIIKFAAGRCPVVQPTAVLKKSAVIKAGGYQSLRIAEDYDLYIRMIQNDAKFHNLQEVLIYVRTSEDFFKRRGGIKYTKDILSFKHKHYKSGFFSLKQFIITGGASAVVTLMPNFVRGFIYKKFLRN